MSFYSVYMKVSTARPFQHLGVLAATISSNLAWIAVIRLMSEPLDLILHQTNVVAPSEVKLCFTNQGLMRQYKRQMLKIQSKER